MVEKEDSNKMNDRSKILEDGKKDGIFGSIKDKEIDHIEYDRWMGGPRGPEKIIFKEQNSFNKAKTALSKNFGGIDFQSQIFAFNYTDYYDKEFGQGLKRVFLSFKKLIQPEELSKIKTFTNKI
ncbi:MAG: DUF4416 family protein, partial [Planctomycetota bacterium]